ncbi:hypothetical protein [Solobacterium moorei]
MVDAINLLFQIYLKFVDFIFDKAEILNGVTLGWIALSVLIFGVLIRSLMAVPSRSQSHTFKGGDKDE